MNKLVTQVSKQKKISHSFFHLYDTDFKGINKRNYRILLSSIMSNGNYFTAAQWRQ